MSSRRPPPRARSPAVTPLDDDDLLCEILLRLPPQPSSFPRASAVCNRWRHLVSDPGFSRRFRLHHRRNPPLLGFFHRFEGGSFVSTLEPPNFIPPERFSLQRDDDYNYDFSISLGCRDGLFLSLLRNHLQVLVWDPITRDKHHIAVPAPFDTKNTVVDGAVLRDADDVQHFQVVLAVAERSNESNIRAFTCIYSSKTGLWGNPISALLPCEANENHEPTLANMDDAVLAGDSVYWKLAGNLFGILEFDLMKQSLAMILVPVNICWVDSYFKVIRAKGGGLGCLVVSDSDCTMQLWTRKIDCDGVASWELAKTIQLDKLLSLKPEEKGDLFVTGFAEDFNAVLMRTIIGTFMIHLDSLKFKKIFETNPISFYQPFESVYAAGACVDGGHDGADLLLNI